MLFTSLAKWARRKHLVLPHYVISDQLYHWTIGWSTVRTFNPMCTGLLEVTLDIPWTYSVDIWDVGCMVNGDQANSPNGTGSNVPLAVGRLRGRALVHRTRSRTQRISGEGSPL